MFEETVEFFFDGSLFFIAWGLCAELPHLLLNECLHYVNNNVTITDSVSVMGYCAFLVKERNLHGCLILGRVFQVAAEKTVTETVTNGESEKVVST